MKNRFLSLDAYGFGSADRSNPEKYYFELDLFQAIDADVCKN